MSRVGTSLLSIFVVANFASASDGEKLATANSQPLAMFAIAFDDEPLQLEAQGPGTLFTSIEDAAVDALTYAYLDGLATRSSDRMRGGTIYRTGNRYSYGDLHVAGPLSRHQIRYALHSRDAARFLIYPRVGRRRTDHSTERPSQVDRRSVPVTDPLHRPLYILHPSLVIREYRGEGYELIEVADLRRPAQEVLNSEKRRSISSSLLAYR